MHREKIKCPSEFKSHRIVIIDTVCSRRIVQFTKWILIILYVLCITSELNINKTDCVSSWKRSEIEREKGRIGEGEKENFLNKSIYIYVNRR